MPKVDPGRVRVAYHEAGHIMAVLASGRRVLSASVWGDDSDSEGATDYETSPSEPHFLEHELFISLAGPLAARRGSPDFGWAGCRGDLRRATDLAGALAPAGVEPTAVLEDRLAAVDRWLAAPDRWSAIEAFATELLCRGTLERAAILALLAVKPAEPLAGIESRGRARR